MIDRIIKLEDIYEVMYSELYNKKNDLELCNEKIFENAIIDEKTKLKSLAKIKFEIKKYFYNLPFITLFNEFKNDINFLEKHTYFTESLNRLEITKATNLINKENMHDYQSIIIHSDILSNLQNRLVCDKGCPLNSSKVEDELRLKIILNNEITKNENGEYISYVIGNKIFDFNANLTNVEIDNVAKTTVNYNLSINKNIDHTLIKITRIISKN
ncbi:hypothetical protein [Streptobacillus canis]|uniref:hypothetical protein n=1 Tax=Streptobacillus canis TaxID=2678686 RepID=UPI0012E0FDEF|nr:hypothetical protein [Streptobacillus canis]